MTNQSVSLRNGSAPNGSAQVIAKPHALPRIPLGSVQGPETSKERSDELPAANRQS